MTASYSGMSSMRDFFHAVRDRSDSEDAAYRRWRKAISWLAPRQSTIVIATVCHDKSLGPARKKASEGTIEVWSYASGGSSCQSQGGSLKTGSLTTHSSSHDRDYCIVNVAMKNGVVTAVNYNGPSESMFAPNEQCGYLVVNCISTNRF